MEFRNKREETADNRAADRELYRLLVAGDLPGAWLAAKSQMEKSGTENISCAAAFNRGLCFYRLGEYEKALGQLRQAEQSLGSPPDFDLAKKKLFLEALSGRGQETALIPLDPDGGEELYRYWLVRVKWLMTLSLLRLDRHEEAAGGIRFLRQYPIELE